MANDRIKTLLEPSYAERLDARSTDDLREMKHECGVIENSVSFYRRLAQGRIEILDAELDRRRRGGSVEELISQLPDILAGDNARSSTTQSRLAEPESPEVELEWDDGRERLITDTTLANLPLLDDAGVESIREELRDFERDLSDVRHQ